MEATTVSCVIACKNAHETIMAAITSALNQADVSVEVIVCDDASTDDSAALVAAAAAIDGRVRLLQAAEASGPAIARNLAIEHAIGDWIAVLDADDEFEPGRLAALLAACRASDAAIAFDNQRVVERISAADVASPDYAAFVDFPHRIDLADFYRLSAFKRTSLSIGYAKPLVRRMILNVNAIRYQPSMHVSEDWRFLHDCIRVAGVAIFLDQQSYRYYRSRTSITRGAFSNAWWPVLRAYASAVDRNLTLRRQQSGLHRLLAATFGQAVLKEGRNVRSAAKALLTSGRRRTR